jgi:uncharacterized surface protein with fasciclin (FAS1) repeats
MNRTFTSTLFLVIALCVTVGCKKKLDDYYERPSSLEPPIYQQLQKLGRFQSLLAVIDKSGYKQTLNAAGYWTFFAPNDEAFKVFFQDRGISGVQAIDSATARAMVQYLLVFNAYTKDQLSSYQSTGTGSPGWQPASAFRRATSYYTGFYNDTGLNGKKIVAVANNRNAGAANFGTDAGYISTDYNNKSITYFTDTYFGPAGLSATDYNYFYPQSQYTGFNVGQAKVITKDVMAENGVFHEIDRVVTPLLSIDEYIRTRPEYSSFKAILNRLYLNNMARFAYNADVTHRYNVLTGKSDSVFVKAYSNLLAFAPNNENYKKDEVNDAQRNCWSIFIPKNDAVDTYLKNVILATYGSLDEVPISVIADFVNSHLFPAAVWPTRFATTLNNAGEPANFNPATDVFDRQMLSNGMLYGVNKVQEPYVFKSVFGKAYLHPKYQMMSRLLDVSGLKLLISRPDINATVLMISDDVFKANTISYNAATDKWSYKSSETGAFDLVTRMVRNCVFFDPYRAQLETETSGMLKSGTADAEGDYIRFNKDSVFTAGLEDSAFINYAHIDSSKTAVNGKVYYINNVLFATTKPIGYHLRILGNTPNSGYGKFWNYVKNWIGYSATTDNLSGISGTFYTAFIPTDTAIVAAAKAGLLPSKDSSGFKVPVFAPTTDADKLLVQNFIQYHFLDGHTATADKVGAGTYKTVLKDANFNSVTVGLYTSSYTELQVKDIKNRFVTVIPGKGKLSNRCVIHLIDNYLQYK